jgi:RNA polymerase sigma-70 factor (ECF subfamily)
MDPDTVSAETLYRQYGFLINRICLKILGSPEDARDALQTVFLKLLEQFETIHDKEKVVPWIFTAAKNHCYNVLRYNKKFSNSQEGDETAAKGDSSDELVSAKEIIRLAFRDHSSKVRDAVYFTYAEEFDQREIRKLTGQSPATIRRNLKRFKESLPSIRKRLGL